MSLKYSQIRERIQEGFSNLGFQSRRDAIFTMDLRGDVLGWLGLNQAVHRSTGSLEINPVIGVRNQKVERCLAELRSESIHKYVPPTISVQLGYLMPKEKYQPWVFHEIKDHQDQIASLVRAVHKFGIPYMTVNADLRTLRKTMAESRFDIPEQTEYRMPIVDYLLGCRSGAAEAVMDRLQTMVNREDLAAQEYRKFAEAFLRQVSA